MCQSAKYFFRSFLCRFINLLVFWLVKSDGLASRGWENASIRNQIKQSIVDVKSVLLAYIER